MAVRPYRRAAGVTAGKTSTAGIVRQAGERECATSKLRRMRAVSRGHRIVAPHGERTKRAGISTVIFGSGKCAALAVTNFAKGSEVNAQAGWEPCRWPKLPHAGHVNASNSLRFAKSSPRRPGSAGAPTAVFAQLSPSAPGIGFRSLASTVAAEHELAGLVSFDYGQRA